MIKNAQIASVDHIVPSYPLFSYPFLLLILLGILPLILHVYFISLSIVFVKVVSLTNSRMYIPSVKTYKQAMACFNILSTHSFGVTKEKRERLRVAYMLPGFRTGHKPAALPPHPRPVTGCSVYFENVTTFSGSACLIDYDVARLCLRTATTIGPIVHPPGDT